MTLVCDILVRADMILTQDPLRSIVEQGGIAITGNTIMDVGDWESINARYHAESTINLGNSLIMPGLVNAHTHAAMTLLRGVADDLPLMEWLTKHIFPVEQHLTAEFVELGALLACAEMTRLGTTSFCDMYLLEDATYSAVDKAGLRILGGEGIFMFPSPAYPNTERGFEIVRELHDKWKNHPRIAQSVMPHAVYTTTPEILTRCRELAEELDIPLNIHLGETVTETEQCLKAFGKRPVQYAHDLGLLSPRTTIAHAVDLTDAEIDLLAETGTVVAHNPESNMKLASGIANIPYMLEKGVKVSLGTDGAASNNALNMFTEMTSCALLHKVRCMDPTCAPAQAVLDMATIGGAAAMHRTDIGSIAPGMKADIIALDLNAPNLLPMHNPVSHAVYAATGAEVRMTMVAGQILYNDGKFLKIDYPSLVSEIRSLRDWVRGKLA
ncbi:amidohydrolase [Desulfovibrio mangrovi]|uniref:amidohydrolase n=1 Tax=Desulfovibrio mangrovi TaxID=2976983 RepID=UPI002246354A|nr:amidohydrolase [Desulfovibrio mangrovi]UZP68210.1 amidohydrolase [Desulfovibrio mangrovi]